MACCLDKDRSWNSKNGCVSVTRLRTFVQFFIFSNGNKAIKFEETFVSPLDVTYRFARNA